MRGLPNELKKRAEPEPERVLVSGVELRKMKAVRARIERVPSGWQATVIREDGKGQLREETFNVRRGSIEGKGMPLLSEEKALQRGREMAREDIRREAPDLKDSDIEVKESSESK